jgi:hypothetical protein
MLRGRLATRVGEEGHKPGGWCDARQLPTTRDCKCLALPYLLTDEVWLVERARVSLILILAGNLTDGDRYSTAYS